MGVGLMRKVRERYKHEQGQRWGRQRDTQGGAGQENSEMGRDRRRNITKERERTTRSGKESAGEGRSGGGEAARKQEKREQIKSCNKYLRQGKARSDGRDGETVREEEMG